MTRYVDRAAKPVTGIVTILALFVGFVVFAPAAFAHHAEAATVDYVCDANGGYNVTWRAISWTSAVNGRHPAVRVRYRLNGGAYTTVPSDNSLYPSSTPGGTNIPGIGRFHQSQVLGNGVPYFDGTLHVPHNGANQTIQVVANALATAPQNLYGPGGELIASTGQNLYWEGTTSQDTSGTPSGILTLPASQCAPQAVPGGSAQVQCAQGRVRFSLTNTGGSAIQLDIVVGGVLQANDVNVPAGTTAASPVVVDRTFAQLGLDENETLPWVIERQNGADVASGNLTRDCQDDPEPSVTVEQLCATGGAGGGVVRITLTNGNDAGGESVTFTINRDGGAATQHVVGPNSSVVVDIPVDEDGTASGTVTAPGMTTGPFNETMDCLNPEPGATFVECADDGVLVNLTNTGSQSVVLEILNDGAVVHTVTVPASGNASRTVTVGEDEDYDIVVRVQNGAVVASASGTRDCQEPVVEITVGDLCATGGVVVELTNTGDQAGAYVIRNNGQPVPGGAGTIGPDGGTVTFTVPVGEGEAYAITVTVDGAPVGAPIGGTRDCQQPAFTGTPECATSQGTTGVSVTLTNSGELAVEVTLSGAPGTVTPNPVTVPAGGDAVVFVAQAEDAAGFTLTGTSAGNPDITIDVAARDCLTPAPTVGLDAECVAGGVSVTLGNLAGADEAVFTVTGVPGTVTVPAGESTTVTVPVAEGAAYSITATVEGDYPVSGGPIEGVRDCQKPVVETVHECAVGGVLIVVTNSGSEPATATVPGATVPVQEVPNGGSATFVIPQAEGAPGGTVTVDLGAGNGSTQVSYPTRNCVVPQVSEIEHECGDDEVVFTLSNTGSLEAIFSVVVTDQDGPVPVDGVDAQGKVTVPGGQSVQVSFPVEENGVYTVTVTEASHPGAFPPQTVVVDCQEAPAPEASAQKICAATGGTLRVTLINDNDDDGESVTFTVTDPDGVQTQHTLGGGESTVLDFPADENETLTVTVSAPGMAPQVFTETFDCARAAVEITSMVECAAAGVTFVLVNEGLDSGAYVVTNNGNQVAAGTIGAGDDVPVQVDVAEGAAYDIVVTVDGVVIGGVDGIRDCTKPAFGDVACSTGNGGTGVTVTLTNDGELDVTVTISGAPGEVSPNPVVVPAGGSVDVFVAQDEDAAGFTLTGTSAGNADIVIDVPTRDCDQPAPTVSLAGECADGGIAVTLGNEDGDDEAVFTVTGLPGTVTVAAGGSETVVVPVPEAAAYSIAATVEGGYPVSGGPIAGVRDCQKPVVEDVHECVADGVVIVVSNEGGEEAVTVTVPGATEPTQTIPAGETRDFLIPRTEGDPATTVTVDTGAGNDDIEVELPERDCVEPGVPQLAHECGAGEVVFSLTNEGVLPTVFTVTVIGPDGPVPVDGADEGEVPVGASGSVELSFPVIENGTYTITITEPSIDPVVQQVIVDCVEPSATIEYECTMDGGITVTLSNEGDDDDSPTVYTITVNGEQFGDPIVVNPGDDPVVVTIPVEENGTYEVVVTEATEGVVAETEIVVDCIEVSAGVAEFECAQGAISVELSNDGDDTDLPATFTVTVNGEQFGDPVTLDPGATETVEIPVEENKTYEVVVTEATEGEVHSQTVEVDCIEVSSTEPVVECVEGEIVVGVVNPGDPTDVTLTLLDTEGNVLDELVLEDFSGETEVVFPDPGTDGPYVVRVDAPGDDYDEEYVVGVDCRHPDPHVRLGDPCVAQGIAVTVGNDGDELATFQVLNNAIVVHELSVEGGDPDVTVVVPVAEDEAYHVVVKVSGIDFPDTVFSGVRDCTDVQGTQTPRGPQTPRSGGTGTQVGGTQLPRTGGLTTSILPLAFGLALAGIGLVTYAAERRRLLDALRMAAGEDKY